jgi:hypothetical protein
MRLAPPRQTRLEEFRVGFVLDHPCAPVASEVEPLLSNAVAPVVGGWPDGIDPVEEAELFGFHVGLFFAYHGQAKLDRPHELVEQEKRRLRARDAWRSYFVPTSRPRSRTTRGHSRCLPERLLGRDPRTRHRRSGRLIRIVRSR